MNSQNLQFYRLQADSIGLEQMKQVNELYADAFKEVEMYRQRRPSDNYLLEQLVKDHVIVCTAVVEDKVIGALTAYVFDKLERETAEMYVYDIAVDENCRRQKTATRLLEFLFRQAGEIDVSAIFIQADKEDKPAVALYESLGAKEEVFHFDIYTK